MYTVYLSSVSRNYIFVGLTDRGTSAEAKQANRKLYIIKNNVYDIYQRMLENKEQISADNILDHYLGKSESQKNLLTMYDVR